MISTRKYKTYNCFFHGQQRRSKGGYKIQRHKRHQLPHVLEFQMIESMDVSVCRKKERKGK